jgi:hypothetical protein
MRRKIPGIESSTVFWLADEIKVSIPLNNQTNTVFRKQKDIIYADDQYFNFINYKWLAGSPTNALKEPNKIVLTESRAKNYFSFPDIRQAIGQKIIYNDTVNLTVTGIVKDLNEVTDIVSKEFVSLSTFSEHLKKNNGWDSWGSVSSSSQFLIKLN